MAQNVTPQITDAVTQTNAKVVGESPAQALATAGQLMAHGVGLALGDAPIRQAGMQDVASATTVVGVLTILENLS